MSLPQPVPPSWKDIGKSSNDLLQKDYPYSSVGLEVKTKTASNVAFKVAGTRVSPTKPIVGDIEAKVTDKKRGYIFTQTWTTANALKTQLELENHVTSGLKFDVNTVLQPEHGAQSALFTTTYKQSGVHTRAALDVFKGPTFTADTVFGRDGYLVGAEAAYNVTEGKISRYAAALGYNASDYAVTFHGLNNLSHFTASYYHRVSPDVEAGAKAVYDSKVTHGGVALEVGAKAYLDSSAFIKAKINNTGAIGLGYTQSLRPGVKVSFGVALDTTKLNEADPTGSSHKIGATLFFES